MDKGKEQNNTEITDDWVFPQHIRYSLDPKNMKELQEILAKLDQNYAERIALIDKAAKSFFADKTHFALVQWLITEEINRLKNEVTIVFGIASINERLTTIETTLQEVGKKVNLEMPELKAQIDSLKENMGQPINRINDFLTEQKKFTDKQKLLEDEILDWATRSH